MLLIRWSYFAYRITCIYIWLPKVCSYLTRYSYTLCRLSRVYSSEVMDSLPKRKLIIMNVMIFMINQHEGRIITIYKIRVYLYVHYCSNFDKIICNLYINIFYTLIHHHANGLNESHFANGISKCIFVRYFFRFDFVPIGLVGSDSTMAQPTA